MAYLDSLVKKARQSESKPARSEDTSPSQPEGGQEEREEILPKGEKVLVDSYGDVKIYKNPATGVLSYDVPVPRYEGAEKDLIDALMRISIEIIPTDVGALTQEEKKRKYYNKILEVIDRTPELKIPLQKKDFYASTVVSEMVGFSLIDPLVADDRLEEIMIIGPSKPVFVFHRKHEMLKTNIVFYDDIDIRNLIERIARTIGRRIDTQSPLLDARLPDGPRFCGLLPTGWARFRRTFSLQEGPRPEKLRPSTLFALLSPTTSAS